MINRRLFGRGTNSGFTMIEVMIVVALIAIIAGIGIPAFSNWLPNYRLKSAATDMFSNMQLAKMEAVKLNRSIKIEFHTSPQPGSYELIDGANVIKSVNLQDYNHNGEIGFGHGSAGKDATTSGGTPPSDGVSFYSNELEFTSRGTTKGDSGYVYVQNQKGTAYAIGTLTSGVIRLRKWNESSGEWE